MKWSQQYSLISLKKSYLSFFLLPWQFLTFFFHSNIQYRIYIFLYNLWKKTKLYFKPRLTYPSHLFIYSPMGNPFTLFRPSGILLSSLEPSKLGSHSLWARYNFENPIFYWNRFFSIAIDTYIKVDY